MSGKLIILSAPSGAGKTTLVKYLTDQDLNLAFSVSACSRRRRQHEIDGEDYYFISTNEFKDKIQKGEFVEWEEVYPGHLYGTLKTEIERIWTQGLNVITDVDVIGGINIKKHYGNQALAIFIMPPSLSELEKRLRKRSTENIENLQERLNKAKAEINYAHEFDKIIVNDNLKKAKQETLNLVSKFLKTPSMF